MTKNHTVHAFDEAMAHVTTDILRMGQLARSQLAAAVALLDQDAQTDAETIVAKDVQVDDFDERIEREVQRLIAQRQPVAGDLRALLSYNRMATDLERIADHAKNIAKRAGRICEQGHRVDFSGSVALGREVIAQLDAVLKAIETSDVAAARRIWAHDIDIDRLFEDIFNQQLHNICQTPEMASSCTNALFIDKSLERVGDHVTNIAEDLVYLVQGDRMSKRETGDSV